MAKTKKAETKNEPLTATEAATHIKSVARETLRQVLEWAAEALKSLSGY